MTSTKTHIISATVLLAGLHSAFAQGFSGGLFISDNGISSQGFSVAKPFEFIFRSDAFYRQDAVGVNFTGGRNFINVRDGQITYEASCVSTTYVPPNVIGFPIYGTGVLSGSPCSRGTSGFLASGDFNNDGIPDPAAYMGVTQINQAAIIELNRPDRVFLVAGPPSELPRPSGGFTAEGAILFFDIQSTNLRQFPLARYFFNRNYTAVERNTYDRQIVEGTYRYNFPQKGNPNNPVPISVNYFGAVDGFREVNNQKRGFRFLGLTFVNGFAQIDPTKANTLRWEGNTPDRVSTAVDQTFLSIKTLSDNSNPLSNAGAGFVFPAFMVPGVTDPRILLPTAIDTSYTLPPGIIAPGTRGLLQITLKRNRGTVVADLSETTFSIPVEFGTTPPPPAAPLPPVAGPLPPFIPTQPGIPLQPVLPLQPVIPPPPVVAPLQPVFAPLQAASVIASKLPPTATAADMSLDTDYDGDGLSNFTEWVFDSDPGDASSVPVSPRLVFEATVQSGRTSRSGTTESDSSKWVLRVEKKRNTVPALKYGIECSSDMNAWSLVKSTDPNWQVVETASEIKVVSRTSSLVGGSFFRVCVEKK